MAFLAGNFAVDVLAFSIMSNHIHVVVRNRPDIVAGWSDEEVARRWWNLFPKRKDRDRQPAEPTDAELSMITAVPERLAEVRTRLSSLSSQKGPPMIQFATNANLQFYNDGDNWGRN